MGAPENNVCRRVLVLSGLPGAGKTRYAIAAREAFMHAPGGRNRICDILSTDDFHIDARGQYVYQSGRISEAHAWCFRRFLELLPVSQQLSAHDILWIIDNTNTQALEIAPYVLAARAHGYSAEIVRLECPLDVALRRNTHGVPEEVIKRMATNLQFPLPPYWPMTSVPFEIPVQAEP